MEIIAGLIAAVGVVISAIISLYVGKQNLKTEVTKLHKDIQQSYAGKLLAKRIELYPSLYSTLSSLVKKRAEKSINLETFKKFSEDLNDWDSKNSIFLSGYASRCCYRCRRDIKQLLIKNEKDIAKIVKNFKSDIWKSIGELELALKSDLGVFVVEFSPEKSQFSNYSEVSKAIQELDE